MEDYLPILGACVITLGAFLFGLKVGQSDRVGDTLAPSIKGEDTPKPQSQTSQATAKPINAAIPEHDTNQYRFSALTELKDEEGNTYFSSQRF